MAEAKKDNNYVTTLLGVSNVDGITPVVIWADPVTHRLLTSNDTPITALGDIIYGGTSGVPTRLAGNTTTTKKFLTQTGTGSASAAPEWGVIVATDIGEVSTPPTDLKISTASKGGVFNGGFETGSGSVNDNGWIGDEKYGWYASFNGNSGGAYTASYDTTISKSGGKSMKINYVAVAANWFLDVYSSDTLTPTNNKKLVIIKPNTTYRATVSVKTSAITSTGGDGVFCRIKEYNSAFTYLTQSNIIAGLKGTVDWTNYSVTFTTNASALYAIIQISLRGESGTAWFDDITLEEVVSNTTFTGKVAEKIRTVLQGVDSTDNVDQNLDSTGAYANTYALTNAVNEGATHIQTFTPTKKYTTQIAVWPIDNGTGNWTLVVHTAGNVVVASKTIANASVTEGAMLYFDVPNIWASGALHFHLYSSVADGTCKANTSNDLETASYIQRYAKKSESFSLIANGIKTELKADKDGILNGAVIDLDNGKYRYNFVADGGSVSDAFANDVFSASAGAGSDSTHYIINNWGSESFGVFSTTDATARTLVIKVNTLLRIKHLKVTFGLGRNTAYSIDISPDNVTWTTIANAAASENTIQIPETDLMNGLSTFYIRVSKTTDASYCILKRLYLEADLDTSSIPQGLFHPLAINQFTETVKLTADASRIYFQKAKYLNENGVVMPAIEYTDASGNMIGYASLKINNSQETSPCISILSTTTNYQQSGTGSNVTGGVVLNDGEYMTLTAATSELKVDYQVGTGTTTISAITKNDLYLSSNGESDDATQDPSHQMNVIVGVRQQGALQRMNDLGEELEEVKNGTVKTSKWTAWTPTLTWTTGTPEGSVVTKARYKIVDGVCYFSFYYSATDANAATALTISLPVLPKDNDTLTALSAQELADTTWSDPLAYIDDGGTTIVFRSFATIADTKAVKVLVSGSYEV